MRGSSLFVGVVLMLGLGAVLLDGAGGEAAAPGAAPAVVIVHIRG